MDRKTLQNRSLVPATHAATTPRRRRVVAWLLRVALVTTLLLTGAAGAQGEDAQDPATSSPTSSPTSPATSPADALRSIAPSAAPPGVEGTLVEVVHEGRLSAADVQRQSAPAFGAYGPVVIENPVESYRIRFVTTGIDGSPTVVAAQAFLPVRAAEGGTPTFVFGSGTTGIGDQCAPSRELDLDRPLGQYREYLMAYAGRGFATIIPDYLGFEDPDRVQAYFHARSEGHVMLDAVRATRQLVVGREGVPPLSGEVFVGGYSQGGHAAFAAADMAPSYAPDVTLSGVVGYGATTNVGRLLADGPYYAPYIAVAYHSVYGADFDPADILAPQWQPTVVEDTVRRCVDQAQTYYPFDIDRMYAAPFAEALRSGRLEQAFPAVHDVLEANRTGLTGHGVPSLVIQGSDDVIATTPTQERFVQELCATGAPVVYVNIAGARHRHTKPAGFEPAVLWMKEIASRGEAPTTCR